jgi:predicted GH43/DUF377 family glycosyl hydrolase
LGPPGTITHDNVNAGAVLYEDGVYKMWYIADDEFDRTETHLAYSYDGIHWINASGEGPVLSSGPADAYDERPGVNSVVRDGMTYRYWFTGRARWPIEIGYAEAELITSPRGCPQGIQLAPGEGVVVDPSWFVTHDVEEVVIEVRDSVPEDLDPSNNVAWSGIITATVRPDFLVRSGDISYVSSSEGGAVVEARIQNIGAEYGEADVSFYMTNSSDLGTTQNREENPVLSPGPSPWDSLGVGYPFVMKDEGIFKMWYIGHYTPAGSGRVGYATSFDGKHWIKPFDHPVLDVSAGEWDSAEVGYVWVLKEDGEYRMWYSGHNGDYHYRIGYASSPDGIEWTKHDGPLLSPGEGGTSWDAHNNYGPIVIKSGSMYMMWFKGAPGWGGPTLMGLATSTDGLTWCKHPDNPVMVPGLPGSLDELEVNSRCILYEDGLYKMICTSARSYDRTILFLATSKDGVIWEKHYDSIVLTSGDDGDFDKFVGDAFAMRDGFKYRLWYGAFTDTPVSWTIGYAEIIPDIVKIDGTRHIFLAPGGETRLHVSWTPVSMGTFRLIVCVSNVVPLDNNYDNNIAWKWFREVE